METPAEKEIIEELKTQWKRLWLERIDDKVRAEGIANKDYSVLFVEKGTVIYATRDFKPLDFREILKLHGFIDADRFVPPSPHVGGWRKFIRTVIAKQSPRRRVTRAARYVDDKEKQRQQLRKGGYGWLHRV